MAELLRALGGEEEAGIDVRAGGLRPRRAIQVGLLDRLQSRFARRVTVFTGLDTLTLPLLRQLTSPAQTSNPGAVIVIEPDETNPLLDEARASGARVIMGDPASVGMLGPVIAGWRGCALDRFYAMSARAPENEEVINAAGEILREYPPAQDRQIHLVARIDDPRHAEAWRGRHVRTDGGWFEDALSPAEVTARTLVGRVLGTAPRYLLICGDSSLTLAILSELARRSWEQAGLMEAAAAGRVAGPPGAFAPGAQAPPPARFPLRRVILLDARAEAIEREYRASTPKEILNAAPGVEAAAGQWRDQLLGRLDGMPPADARKTVVIIVDGPDEASAHEAGRLARLHPKTPVFILAAAGSGMREAIFDRLHPFELGLLIDDAVPDDSWTRIARHWHECYRLSHPVAPGEKGAGKRLPWNELEPFLRQEDILQVRSILKLVSQHDRTWIPVRMVPSGSHVELTASEIEDVASREHARWLRRQPPESLAANPYARPWDELTREQRKGSCESVVTQLGQLADVGFLPAIPPGGPDGTGSFERTGTVRASRLTSRMPWRLHPGEELHGKPGDWHIVDATGNERTMADKEFQVSHENLGNGQWRRVGTFRAWQVREDQVVWTKEGKVTAKAGNWIVEGAGGGRWPIPDDQFGRAYRPVADPPLPDHRSLCCLFLVAYRR